MATVNNEFKEVIKEHLDKMAKRDGNFAQMYRKENKSLDECINYIMSEMRKRGSAVVAKDEEVFGMAVHYYEEDSIKDVPAVSGHVSAQRRKIELTDEEREKLRIEAEKEYKEQVKKELVEERPANNSAKNVEQVIVPTMFDF